MRDYPDKKILDFAETDDFEVGEAVDLIISAQTDLGYKAVINGSHWGVLYEKEVFKPLRPGQFVRGYIKKIREDGKLDLSLYQTGIKDADDIGEKILQHLKTSGGFLATEKTSAEDIYKFFGVSKKKYKIALSRLYKNRLVLIDDAGVHLVKK
jgi:hypothetical protein